MPNKHSSFSSILCALNLNAKNSHDRFLNELANLGNNYHMTDKTESNNEFYWYKFYNCLAIFNKDTYIKFFSINRSLGFEYLFTKIAIHYLTSIKNDLNGHSEFYELQVDTINLDQHGHPSDSKIIKLSGGDPPASLSGTQGTPRKLPLYILLDTSGSMRGVPIQAVEVGMSSLLSSLRRDPHSRESVRLCVITFDREAKVLMPMTALEQALMPSIPPLESSPTMMGAALELMCRLYEKDVRKSTATEMGDWPPLAVVMTDGSPSDTLAFQTIASKLKSDQYRFSRIIGCAAGPKATLEHLKTFATDVVTLETMDSHNFAKFWPWVSQTVTKLSQSSDMAVELPDPPKEIVIA